MPDKDSKKTDWYKISAMSDDQVDALAIVGLLALAVLATIWALL